MDYGACMKNEDNIDDVLTLAWFKGWLGGMDKISNSESNIKKSGNYEFHDQYITELGIQYLVSEFKTFMENKSDISVTNSSEAEKLIFDDLLSYCKDLSSRTIFSLVLDKVSLLTDFCLNRNI
jgi:hypothetical protein